MNKFLKKLILVGILFIPFFALSLVFFGSFFTKGFSPNLVYRKGGHGHTFSRLKDAKTIGDVDILFLGNSHAYRGFDPRIFETEGYKCLNLGSSSQTAIQTEYLLNRYLERLNPEIVIYEINPYYFNLDGQESAINIISNDLITFSSLDMVMNVGKLKPFLSLIYAVLTFSNTSYGSFTEAKNIKLDKYVKGGYVQRNDSLTLPYNKPYSLDGFSKKENKKQLEAFKRIVELLNEQKCRILFVEAPVTSFFYKEFKRMKSMNYDSLLGPHYYNYNLEKSFSDSLHFFDKDHLNYTGVKHFNSLLLRRHLKKHK